MKRTARLVSSIALMWLLGAPLSLTTHAARRVEGTSVKYFGYFGSQFIGGVTDYCDEAFDHVNVIHLLAYSVASITAQDGINDEIEAAAACGKKSIVSIDPLFFDVSAAPNSGNHLELNWSHNWSEGSYGSADGSISALAESLYEALESHLPNVVGLFVFDEPFHNSHCDFDTDPLPNGMCADEDEERVETQDAATMCSGVSGSTKKSCHRLIDIEHVTAVLKARFPDTPLMINFAWTELLTDHPERLPKIPDNIDWVGFDCYPATAPADAGTFDGCYYGWSIADFVAELESFMTGSQKVFVVPPAFVSIDSDGCEAPHPTPSTGQLEVLEDFVDGYRALAENDPLVTMVWPYAWTSYCASGYNPDHWNVAAVDLNDQAHDIQARLRDWGESIVEPQSNVALVIDIPNDDSYHIRGFTLAGWAIDEGALTGTGIDLLAVYAVPNAGQGQAVLVDNLTVGVGGWHGYGSARTDIATAFGPQYRRSGFSVQVGITPTSLGPGVYDVIVFPHSAVTGQFDYNHAVVRRVTIPASDVEGNIDLPSTQNVGTGFTVAGWALDKGAPYGTGIDAVHVWACPHSTGCGGSGEYATFLAAATYGGARSDIGGIFGSQFTNSGYGVSISWPLSNGEYDLIVYARSTLTGEWTARVKEVTVTSEGHLPAVAAATMYRDVAFRWAWRTTETSGLTHRIVFDRGGRVSSRRPTRMSR